MNTIRISACVIAIFVTQLALADEPIRKPQVPLADLIQQLASPQFATREAATQELVGRLDGAGALRTAALSANAEIARRAKGILVERQVRSVQSACELGKRGSLDLMVERLVAAVEAPDATVGQGILDVQWALIDRVGYELPKLTAFEPKPLLGRSFEQNFGKNSEFPIRMISDREIIQEPFGYYVVVASTLNSNNLMGRSMVVVAGKIRIPNFHSSVILTNGDLIGNDFANNCVLVSDQNIEFTGIHNSIVIARKSVKCKSPISKNVIIAGDQLNMPKTLRADLQNYIKENDHFALNFVHFFEPTDAGIEVTATQGGVAVAKLLDGQPPKKAGLKVGDIITAVDGKATTDLETFRRLLRRGTVLEETKFAVKRDGKEITVTASFLGWEPPVLKPAK